MTTSIFEICPDYQYHFVSVSQPNRVARKYRNFAKLDEQIAHRWSPEKLVISENSDDLPGSDISFLAGPTFVVPADLDQQLLGSLSTCGELLDATKGSHEYFIFRPLTYVEGIVDIENCRYRKNNPLLGIEDLAFYSDTSQLPDLFLLRERYALFASTDAKKSGDFRTRYLSLGLTGLKFKLLWTSAE